MSDRETRGWGWDTIQCRCPFIRLLQSPSSFLFLHPKKKNFNIINKKEKALIFFLDDFFIQEKDKMRHEFGHIKERGVEFYVNSLRFYSKK